MRLKWRHSVYLLLFTVLISAFFWFLKKDPDPAGQPVKRSESRESLIQNTDPTEKDNTGEPEVPSNPIVEVFFESDDGYVGTESVEEHDHIIREWRGTLNPSPEELRERLSSLKPGDKFTIGLPSLGQTELTINKAGAIGTGRVVVKASYGPDSTKSTVIVFVGEAISMAIGDLDARREYSLRNGPGGFQYVSEIDLEVAMVCQTCVQNLNPSARP